MALLIRFYSGIKNIIHILLNKTTTFVFSKVFSVIFKMDDLNQEPKFDSSDSSDEVDSSNYVFYRDRPEWNDVKPISQDDGVAQVVRIVYSEKFTDVYDYFRGVLKSGEKSKRTLDLVTDAIALNPANYTVWIYRLEIVLFLNLDLRDELHYISDVIREFSKNYQVWQYRKNIVEILKDPADELEFTADILNMDGKNYHAWQYRQWVLRTYSHLMEKELHFVDTLISQDMRNNSAWNQRYFVLNNLDYNPDMIEKELKYTMDKIISLIKNESAWNYLRGLILLAPDDGVMENKIRDFCLELYNKGRISTHLMSCMIDLLVADENSTEPENIEKVKFALKLCYDLATVYDPIRRYYWAYISSELEEKYNIKDNENKIEVLDNK